MTNTVSFISANFVAQQLDYNMTQGWSEGQNATEAYYKPIETYAERIGAMLDEVKGAGFSRLDIWAGHLNPAWATDEHIRIIREEMEKRGMSFVSFAVSCPADAEVFETNCRVARDVGASSIAVGGQMVKEMRDKAAEILRTYGIRYAFENHPQKNAEEVYDYIGRGEHSDVIGVALDTGWCGTQGWDAVAAVHELKDRLFHVHLKDIVTPEKVDPPVTMRDLGHETCALGDGIVPIWGVMEALKEVGFDGPISIEHEPEDFDPMPDIKKSLQRLKERFPDLDI